MLYRSMLDDYRLAEERMQRELKEGRREDIFILKIPSETPDHMFLLGKPKGRVQRFFGVGVAIPGPK